jgi:hypothetical protein
MSRPAPNNQASHRSTASGYPNNERTGYTNNAPASHQGRVRPTPPQQRQWAGPSSAWEPAHHSQVSRQDRHIHVCAGRMVGMQAELFGSLRQCHGHCIVIESSVSSRALTTEHQWPTARSLFLMLPTNTLCCCCPLSILQVPAPHRGAQQRGYGRPASGPQQWGYGGPQQRDRRNLNDYNHHHGNNRRWTQHEAVRHQVNMRCWCIGLMKLAASGQNTCASTGSPIAQTAWVSTAV